MGASEEVHMSQMPGFEAALEFEGRSEFSHIRVYRGNTTRCLIFVRDSGVEAVQSCIDMEKPDELQVHYLREMVQCHRYAQAVNDVLVIGLGGGSLVHFYRKKYPNVRLDVVEIDPAIIWVADKFFGARPQENIRIMQADAIQFLAGPGRKYDVIYVDAFLKPSSVTTGSGQPLALLSQGLEQMKQRLNPGGVASFNCHDGYDDITSIRRSFPVSYVHRVPGASVVMGVHQRMVS